VRGRLDARIAPSPQPSPRWGEGAISCRGEGAASRLAIDLGLTVASHGWFTWSHGAAERDRTLLHTSGSAAGSARSGCAAGPRILALRGMGFPTTRPRRSCAGSGTGLGRVGPGPRRGAATGAGGRSGDRGARGGRLLRGSTFYEIHQDGADRQHQLVGTCRMSAALVAEPGGGAFPTPDAMLDYGRRGCASGPNWASAPPRLRHPAACSTTARSTMTGTAGRTSSTTTIS